MAKKTKTAKKNKSVSKKSNKTNALKKDTFKNSKTNSNQRANNEINKLKKRKNQNVSSTIQNGTAVIFEDQNLEFGRDTKKEGHKKRFGHIVDSNKKDEVAIAKRQHSSEAISIITKIPDPKNKEKTIKFEQQYNPHLKTKDKNGNPLKIDGTILMRANPKHDITPKEANEIKKQALKDKSKNIRKPNKKRLKELKGRK